LDEPLRDLNVDTEVCKSGLHAIEKVHEVARPSEGKNAVADGVLHEQIPADHPSRQFAEGDKGVGISAAADRDARGKLGVA
jgi:hypothetical protein